MNEQTNSQSNITVDTSAWEAMGDAHVRYCADPSPANRDTWHDSRRAWLISQHGINRLRELGCGEAADHFADLATWQQWATAKDPALREYAAQVCRDANILIRLTRDSEREVVNQALRSLLGLLQP